MSDDPSRPAEENPKDPPAKPSAEPVGDEKSKAQSSADDAPRRAADDDDELPETGESDFYQNATTITNIFGLQAEYAMFASSEGSKRPASGRPIDAAEVSILLTAFCRAPGFAEAQDVLSKRGVVLLVGAEGTGRYVAALALLSGWPDVRVPSPITSYIPTATVGDIARRVETAANNKKLGGRHLLHDLRGDGRASAVQRFDLDRLKATLPKIGARLVVTADPSAVARGDFDGLAVTWTPPDPVAVFTEHYERCGTTLTAEELARARTHVTGLTRPAEVVAFVGRLVDGVDKAMHSQSEVDRVTVRDWFGDNNRDLTEELAVAAACFLHRVPERIVERCLSRLHQLVRDHDHDERAPRAEPLSLHRGRQVWAEGTVLLTTVDGAGRFSERLVAFRSQYVRQHALNELWNRYGYGLLQPMREWIGELAQDKSVDVRIQTAAGLALLAERRWPEVKESFLEVWADGDFAHRLAAANVLNVMAASELLAPIALETALDWAENRGPRRATTAAFALGGPLGLRYRDKAFEELWYLTRRGQNIRIAASIGLAVLLAGAAARSPDGAASDQEPAPGPALSILRTAWSALEWTTKRQRGLERRHALFAIGTMLAATSFNSDELVVAWLLRAEPAAVPVVGQLLAAVLESSPHFHIGLGMLRRLLKELGETEDALVRAGQLGSAVFQHWTADTRSVLIPRIEHGLSRPDEPGTGGGSLAKLRPNRPTGGGGGAVEPEITRRIIRSFVESIGRF